MKRKNQKPNIPHKNLTGANLHEPKGIENASAGDVYIADGVDSGAWTEPGGAVYGEMKVITNGTAQTLASASDGTLNTSSDYVQVDSGIWEAGELSGMTFDSDGYLLIATSGIYTVTFFASIASAGATLGAVKFSVDNTNGTLSPRKLSRKYSAGGDVGAMAATSLVSLTAGDKFSIFTAVTTGTDVTFIDCGASAILLKAD